MKTILTAGLAFMMFSIMVNISAFADHPTVNVSIPEGSSSQGCETSNNCYIESAVAIDVGGEVVWSNDDAASHTVTSGTANDGPDDVFDSGLLMTGQTFSHTFEDAGEFQYFCRVHPWMTGVVTVQESDNGHTDEESTGTRHGDETPGAMVMTQDGSVVVHINSDEPTEGAESVISVEFVDADENPLEHVNFDIAVTQDGNDVLTETEQHVHSGAMEFTTTTLDSDSPLDVKVTILGMGLPTDDPATWTGPKGETVSAQVVPEFGSLAMIILACAIVSIVTISARSKVIPKL